MTLAYVKPGVTVSEIVSPSYSPLLLDPTGICIVGPAQGFQQNTEVFVLDDNHPVQLAKLNIDPTTISVQDASNVTLAPFTSGSMADYTIDTSALSTTGIVNILRSMQTTIADEQKVVAYYENSGSPAQGSSFTNILELDGTTQTALTNATSGTVAGSVFVTSKGQAVSGTDFTLANLSAPGSTLVWKNTATVLKKFQTVWVDYVVGDQTFTDVEFQLNNLTTVALPDNTVSAVVKNAPGATGAITVYQKGTTNDLDYVLNGSGATSAIQRSAGTTTIGTANDKLSVKVVYQATPSDYWLPTRCFSQSDVESKFGSAFDSSGNILTPVAFAAALAFGNGANSVIIQALFQAGTPNTSPTGSVDDWENTFLNLRNVESVNVIVPLISTGTLTSNDAINLQILLALQNHIAYMANQQNQLVIGITGEDSTSSTTGSEPVLQLHAESIGANEFSDSMVVVSPASFTFANPVNGATSNMGGQYVAACVAGMLARYPVQSPLTRKRVNVVTGVNEARTETQKDQDAQAGLLVVEAKRGMIRVRHGITTSQDSVAARELSVVRGKHYMMENIRQALDDQVVGQMIIDTTASFKIQLLVAAELQLLINTGSIVSYDAIQVSQDPNDPTAMLVRFSYLPAFPLNTVSVSFSIDTSQGVSFATTSSSNVQGI